MSSMLGLKKGKSVVLAVAVVVAVAVKGRRVVDGIREACGRDMVWGVGFS